MTTPHADASIEQLAAIFNYEPKRRPLDPPEVAELTRKSIGTLENYRTRGGGPRFFKLGKHVVYSEVDVLRWLCDGAATSTSAYFVQRTPHASGKTSAAATAAASS